MEVKIGPSYYATRFSGSKRQKVLVNDTFQYIPIEMTLKQLLVLPYRAGGSGPASQANAGPIISVRDMVKIVSSTSLYSSDFTAVARRIVTTAWLRHNLWPLLPHNVLLQVSRLVIPLINQEIYLILRFHLASLK